MIECKNVTIGYGKKIIAKDLSFAANSGEITVILGKNGCGKSTLLKSISGIIPFDGSIMIDGRALGNMRASERSKLVSLMPQMIKSPSITVKELVSFGRHPYTGIYGRLSSNDLEKINMIIDELGISYLADSKLDSISGGERQKAYFAMLMAQDTPALLLDEPNSHLDNEYSASLCGFLSDEKRKGKTVVAVLHDINRAVAAADKLIVIHGGTIVFDGSSRDFCLGDIPDKIFGLKRYYGHTADGNNECIFFK